ncbi:MAG: M20 family metallopeptidase [Deltaproteobacteria bacterium]|nr:M20 family metallopeptidase [Deltaproteobacteria bacterium]MBW2129243.1 M20 family metallopeptidase [Deltaproteobacteria bacterium]
MPGDPTPLSLTRKLLAFQTVNPPGGEVDCARYIGGLLEEGGFSVRYQEWGEGRVNLVASKEKSGEKKPVCFTGHLDTVPLGNVPWTRDPFSGEVDGDRIYGRGSSDMKGGVAAMVLAALRLSPILPGRGGLKLVLTAGEEQGCVGAIHLAGSRYLGEAGALVVGEPSSNYPVLGHKGAMFLEARTRGVTAHGSMPEQGVNAIYKAARAVLSLERFDFGGVLHPVLGRPTLNVGTFSAGLNVNSVPDLAVIGIDIRSVPGQDHEEIVEKLRTSLGGEVEIERRIDAESIWTDPRDPWVREVFEIVTPYLEGPPGERGVSYFTDGSALKPALGNPPTLILGPGEPSMAHKTDEFCLLSRIEAAAEIYEEIIRRWCAL